MIELVDVCKYYKTRRGKRLILDNIGLTIKKGERVGILGKNGSGKSTLIRLISGSEWPTSGRINRAMSVSWPLALGGGFQGSLTGLDNLRFICRVYGASYKDVLPFIEDFSELGIYLGEPVKTYSAGMRARLAFAMSMAIEFDCFLIDEVISVGDARFHEKCHHELFVKRRDRSIFLVSHEAHNIREHCERAYVLDAGKLHDFKNVDTAYDFYNSR